MEKERKLTKKEVEELIKNKKFKGKFIDKRGDRRIVIKEHTLWTKTEISILAYLVKNNNKPVTYREIARAYISSSYSQYQKACENLVSRGKLEKLENGSFKGYKSSWKQIKKGTETTERSLPYFNHFLKKLKQRKRL